MFPASTTLSLQPMCETSQTFHMFLPQIQLEHPKTYFKQLSSHWSQQPATFPNAGSLLVWCRSCPRLPVLLRQTPQLHNDKRASKGRPWLHNGNETVIWLTVWGKLWHIQKKTIIQHLFETLVLTSLRSVQLAKHEHVFEFLRLLFQVTNQWIDANKTSGTGTGACLSEAALWKKMKYSNDI